MKENETSLGQNRLPDFKTNWKKITNQLPRIFPPSGWEDVFDSILVTWRDYGNETEARVKLFTEALTLPNVPELEVSDASETLKTTKKAINEFTKGIRAVAFGVKFKWEKMYDLSNTAEEIRGVDSDRDFQAIALLQVISEAHKEGRTPMWIRQRIAQHAFDEIINTGKYRIFDYSGPDNEVEVRSTQDDFNTEKTELSNALTGELWDVKKTEQRAVDYRRLRKIILNGNNSVDTEVADLLKSLWMGANGKGVTKNSALYYLQLSEDIYRNLESGEAFDIELFDGVESDD